MEMKSTDPNINHSAAVLETRRARKEDSNRVGWGQLSSQNSRPLTVLGSSVADAPVAEKDWTEKYRVMTPVVLDEKNEEYTRFDKYKARYMGRYNVVDQSKTDMSYEDFGALVAAQEYSFKNGDILTGTVLQYDGPQKAMIEVGAKTAAVLPLREATIAPLGDGETISNFVDVGEQYEFQIVSDSRDDGQVTVSIKKIMYGKAWEKVTASYAEDPVFEGEVVQVNRGGAIVLVEGLRAFLPGSHIMGVGGASEALVGKTLSLKFLDVSQEDNKLVVSNRRAVLEHSMESIENNTVYDGTVTGVKPYGAFVDILGISGLLHISQISYDRVENIEATLTAGMEIKCMVIDHDKVAGRITLSTKVLEAEPGDMLRDPTQGWFVPGQAEARIEAEKLAREQAAKEMVLGLSDSLDGLDPSADDALGSLDNLEDV
jgi:small subunit ribosomal protein S1